MDEMPQELLAGIGEIIARWGYLQFQLHAVIREIASIKDKKTGRVLLIGPELNVMCNMISTFTATEHWIADKKLREDIRALGEDVQSKSKHRNDYAHGVFGYGEMPGTYVRFLFKAAKHRINPETEELTVNLLKEKAEIAGALWLRAQYLTVRLKAWRQKQP